MLEQRWSRPVTVTKFGVSIKIAGRTLSYGQHDPRLTDLVGSGRKVHVTFNPADLNAVRVYDERFALVCEAPMNTRHGGPTETPLAKRDLHAAIARQRQHRRDIKRQVDIAAAVLPIADLARIEEREREVATTKARMQADGVENPPPMRLVNAPISGSASDDDASSVPLRKAAGAECDEMPRRSAANSAPTLRISDDDFIDDAEEPPAAPSREISDDDFLSDSEMTPSAHARALELAEDDFIDDENPAAAASQEDDAESEDLDGAAQPQGFNDDDDEWLERGLE